MLRHGLGSDAPDVQRLNDIIAPHAAFVKGPLRGALASAPACQGLGGVPPNLRSP